MGIDVTERDDVVDIEVVGGAVALIGIARQSGARIGVKPGTVSDGTAVRGGLV